MEIHCELPGAQVIKEDCFFGNSCKNYPLLFYTNRMDTSGVCIAFTVYKIVKANPYTLVNFVID